MDLPELYIISQIIFTLWFHGRRMVTHAVKHLSMKMECVDKRTMLMGATEMKTGKAMTWQLSLKFDYFS